MLKYVTPDDDDSTREFLTPSIKLTEEASEVDAIEGVNYRRPSRRERDLQQVSGALKQTLGDESGQGSRSDGEEKGGDSSGDLATK